MKFKKKSRNLNLKEKLIVSIYIFNLSASADIKANYRNVNNDCDRLFNFLYFNHETNHLVDKWASLV